MSFYCEWDKTGDRFWETGVDRGVLYVQNPSTGAYGNGVVWDGLTSVQIQPTGGEANPQYADNIKYLNLFSLEEIGATIEAFQAPDEFMECDGGAAVATGAKLFARAQVRKPFGFTWRTRVGNDLDDELAYKIHILYGCKASPSERQYQTVNESPEASTMSWTVTTTPPSIQVTDAAAGLKPTSLFELDTRDFPSTGTDYSKLTWLENTLYGTAAVTGTNAQDAVLPTLPSVADLVSHFKTAG